MITWSLGHLVTLANLKRTGSNSARGESRICRLCRPDYAWS
ncbi:hypothetical protein [Brevibacillus porteri]